MKLSAFKKAVQSLDRIVFGLPDGTEVPSHYHVTEVGAITKNFIDCGGVVREEKVVNFQLWYSDDEDHRLKPGKMLKIIEIAETTLGIQDHEIEVEYQSDTIGKYGLDFQNNQFVLTTKMTDCLAKDNCGVSPVEKKKINLSSLIIGNNCTPGGGCC